MGDFHDRDAVRQPGTATSRPRAAPSLQHRRRPEVSRFLAGETILALRAKPACPRASSGGTFGLHRTSEDCLYLNIFTKNLEKSQVGSLACCHLLTCREQVTSAKAPGVTWSPCLSGQSPSSWPASRRRVGTSVFLILPDLPTSRPH